MLKRHRLWGWLAVVGLVLAVAVFAMWQLGLPSPNISLLSAHLQTNEGGQSLGFVRTPKKDMLKIIHREYYIRARIFSCAQEHDFYPLDLGYEGVSMDNFRVLSAKLDGNVDKIIDLSFFVPQSILDRYSDRCIRLYGGQMMGVGRVSSRLVKVQLGELR